MATMRVDRTARRQIWTAADVDLSSRQAVFAAFGRSRGCEPARNIARPRRIAKPSTRWFPRNDRPRQSSLRRDRRHPLGQNRSGSPGTSRSGGDRGASAIRAGLVSAAGEKGAATAIIITAGLGHGAGSLAGACEKAARATGLRLVGPNCLGVLAPRANLNASFAARMPPVGDLALVSQSGAITAGLVEWSATHGIGFSAAVSLGDKIDVDFGDLLDFFALDRATRAILLYIELINNARKFMSAARAAARIKPVVVVKSGRHTQGAKAAQTHTGALAGADSVYDAAFRRAGLLRVLDLDELFAAAETLGRVPPFSGKRLAILTNGGGIGVLAVDRLVDLGGTLAGISPEIMKKLDAALPPIWSHADPVDIAGDADGARYIAALEALLEDPENDAVLVMNVPTALASAEAAAKSIAAIAQAHRSRFVRPKPIFAVWVGSSDAVTPIFEAARIPNYATESDAVRGFMHLVRYREAHEALMATPPSLPQDFKPDVAVARAVIEGAVQDGRALARPDRGHAPSYSLFHSGHTCAARP